MLGIAGSFQIVRVGDDFVELKSEDETRFLPLARVETVIFQK